MAENLVGNLFGVDIHLPLKRSEVRDLIVARDNFIKNLMEQKNLNEMQASLDASDMLIDFCTQLSDEDSAHLSQILQEESMAVMPPIADTFDQIEKKPKVILKLRLAILKLRQSLMNYLPIYKYMDQILG